MPTPIDNLMAALERVCPDYAVLHEEQSLADGLVTSDIDVVVREEAVAVTRRLAAAVSSERPIAPLLLWPYDTRSLTSFWFDDQLNFVAQLDLLCDPAGSSKYGIRTDVLLDCHVARGQRWRALTSEAEIAYLISKRWLKGDSARLAQLTFVASPHIAEQPFLTVRARKRIRQAMSGEFPRPWAPFFLSLLAKSPGRVFKRLLHPVGAMVNVLGKDQGSRVACDALTQAFEGHVPLVKRVHLRNARVMRLVYSRKPAVLIATDVGNTKSEAVVDSTRETLASALNSTWSQLSRRVAQELEEVD